VPAQLKTSEVVRHLGTNLSRIQYLLRHGKIAPPGKDASGDFVWTSADIDAARAALAKLAPRVRAGHAACGCTGEEISRLTNGSRPVSAGQRPGQEEP
jgi:hypothetical protein